MSEAVKETKKESAKASEKEKPEAGGMAMWRISASVFLVGLVLDHLTKFWAVAALKPEGIQIPRIPIIPGLLQFVYAENTGAAFSFMTGKTFLLGLISLAATIGLSWFWYSLPAREKWGRAAAAMILSGAVGNMIDRFARGYVVDFIDAYWKTHHWPTFNVADSLICVGAAILAVRFLQGKI